MSVTNTKKSKQREILLEILQGVTCHPSADYIYEQAKSKLPNISLGTVYRNLSLLTEQGQIIKLDIGTGREHYDGTITPHYHFVCKQCGEISDLDLHYLEKLNEAAGQNNDFHIHSHSLIFSGICSNCKKQNNTIQ